MLKKIESNIQTHGRLLKVEEAAKELNVSRFFFYHNWKKGLSGLYKIGRNLRVNLPEFLEACKTEKPGNGEASHAQ